MLVVALGNCTNTLLAEIADRKHFKQRDVAKTYALAMRSQAVAGESVDWKRVNAAIIERWSIAGLNSIKKLAHSGKCFE